MRGDTDGYKRENSGNPFDECDQAKPRVWEKAWNRGFHEKDELKTQYLLSYTGASQKGESPFLYLEKEYG